MQDRYAGDIGDYIKLALLRALAPDHRLGVAWYLYPSESHNSDGKHTAYLSHPERWRWLDPELFDALKSVVQRGRSVAALENLGAIAATFHNEIVPGVGGTAAVRSELRHCWFKSVLAALRNCDLAFADPDNGLVDDDERRRRRSVFGKQMPLQEAQELADGRSAIIYHHNTRFRGGHDLEVQHWKERLGSGTIAIRANAYSCRTFFIVNPTRMLQTRAAAFCGRWSNHGVRLDC